MHLWLSLLLWVFFLLHNCDCEPVCCERRLSVWAGFVRTWWGAQGHLLIQSICACVSVLRSQDQGRDKEKFVHQREYINGNKQDFSCCVHFNWAMYVKCFLTVRAISFFFFFSRCIAFTRPWSWELAESTEREKLMPCRKKKNPRLPRFESGSFLSLFPLS